jgi:hypothetical protein
MNLAPWLILALGLVSAGESSALLAGMSLPSGPGAWMTPSNISYAASDIAVGIGLSAAAISGRSAEWYVGAGLGFLLLSNGVRAAEFLAKKPEAFCANGALFAVDIVKTAFAAAILLSGTVRR